MIYKLLAFAFFCLWLHAELRLRFGRRRLRKTLQLPTVRFQDAPLIPSTEFIVAMKSLGYGGKEASERFKVVNPRDSLALQIKQALRVRSAQ